MKLTAAAIQLALWRRGRSIWNLREQWTKAVNRELKRITAQ